MGESANLKEIEIIIVQYTEVSVLTWRNITVVDMNRTLYQFSFYIVQFVSWRQQWMI